MSDEPPDNDARLTMRDALIVALALIGGCALLVTAMMWLTQP
jgi:hypothetical protein